MIKRFLQFVLFLTVCVSSYSQAVTYNAIATAYVTTTITQAVVFNSTMQQGGTFTFSVLAHNGGGRAGQSDTANVKIQFYTSSNALVATVNSSYNANLPNPNAVCGNPCIDTAVPWTTLTTSTTLSAAQAATVAYAKVSMYGIDGSYWAGDYGPWYRAPTLQLNGGGNLLYNPEFGPYNNITAQGWTSSPGFGACQGAWGGSNACIVNSDGVPGQSTVGLVANANGGGPSATGGTTSGQAGGYNSTMSVTNAGTGATAGAPPAPTVTSTSVTYTTRQVVNGNVTYTYRTPVTRTNYSDGTYTTSSGTEVLYSTTTVSWTDRQEVYGATTYTYRTEVTTVTIAGGATTTTTGTEYLYSTYVDPNYAYPSYVTIGSGTTGNMTFGTANPITTDQQTKLDIWTNKTIQDGNKIYIQQISGDLNTVTMDQVGNKNLIRMSLNGTNNTIKANQGVSGIGQNEMKLTFDGNNNVINLNQARDTQGNPVGGNGQYLDANIAGWGNVLTVQQTNNGGVGGHYNETTISGNGNSVLAKQTDNGNKIMFIKVDGAINTVEAVQKGTGQHRADITLTGDRNNASLVQEGSVANNATLNLTNAGGPATVNVQQNGGQSVNVTTTCSTAGGCAAIQVRQGY